MHASPPPTNTTTSSMKGEDSISVCYCYYLSLQTQQRHSQMLQIQISYTAMPDVVCTHCLNHNLERMMVKEINCGFHLFVLCFQMNLLLKEYLISGDVSEAEHCLRDLEVPHFHHELVYEVLQSIWMLPGVNKYKFREAFNLMSGFCMFSPKYNNEMIKSSK